jgi:methionine biosynthesis protein MetW
MKHKYSQKVYSNRGNSFLLSLKSEVITPNNILDIGCGDGSNLKILKQQYKNSKLYGVTLSEREKEICLKSGIECLIFDIESGIREPFFNEKFDLIILSHVLEHLINPALVLRNLVQILNNGGEILIGVPNTLNYQQRIKFLTGKWNYTQSGILDRTHLTFFTFDNILELLEIESLGLSLIEKRSDGKIPIGPMRNFFPNSKVISFLDSFFVRKFPNLLGWQVCLVLSKK